MAKFAQRNKALTLRRLGKSLNEIASELGVSKGSVSAWCRDITLTTVQAKKLRDQAIKSGNVGRLKGAAMNRHKKEVVVTQQKSEALKQLGTLSERDLFMLGLGLYWGEGVKTSGTRVAIVNSDPYVILLSKRWFVECLHVSSDRFRPVIFINEVHRSREERLLAYWSTVLALRRDQFSNTVFLKVKNKKVYENHDSYYGIVALRIARPGELKYRILGLLEALGKKNTALSG
jgi:transcriptional regulator with XRE-family HTH domain